MGLGVLLCSFLVSSCSLRLLGSAGCGGGGGSSYFGGLGGFPGALVFFLCLFVSWIWGLWGIIFLFRGPGRFSRVLVFLFCSFLVSSCSCFLLGSGGCVEFSSCFGGLLGGFPGVFGFFLCSLLVSSCFFLLLGAKFRV